ncbi:MAG: hypothetical protein II943_06815 [Victivallales bacterium]|nr:hypothetical protein [Victivallales bacterium]
MLSGNNQELSVLLRKYRALVKTGSVEEKVLLARQILCLQPNDNDWRETLRTLENQWQKELMVEAQTAIQARNDGKMEELWERLSNDPWLVKPTGPLMEELRRKVVPNQRPTPAPRWSEASEIRQSNAASSKTEKEDDGEVQRLLSKYRRLVHGGSVADKIAIAKQILNARPEDVSWRSTLRELEGALKNELTEEAKEAIRKGDVIELERIHEVLAQGEWQVPPQPEAMAKIEEMLAQLHQRQWEQEGQAICDRLDQQYRDDLEGGLDKMAGWFEEWDNLRKEHPSFVPTEEQERLLAVIRPNWQGIYQERQREEAADRDYARLTTQLEQAIKKGASQKELLEIYDGLERLDRDMPETLLQRYDTALEQARTKEHRRAVITRVIWVLILLMVGGAVFFGFREWSIRELTGRYSSLLNPILTDPTRDAAEAEAIFAEMKERQEALLGRPEFKEALKQLGQKKENQAANSARMQLCGSELRELLPHYRENRQRIAELRKELQDLPLVPEMAEERQKILEDYEQAAKQFVEYQDRKHLELLSGLQQKYMDFNALLENGEDLAKAREMLAEMDDVLRMADKIEDVSDRERTDGEKWQSRLERAAGELEQQERLAGVLDTILPTLNSLKELVAFGEELSFEPNVETKEIIDSRFASDFSPERLNGLIARGEEALAQGQDKNSLIQQTGSPRGRTILMELDEQLGRARSLAEKYTSYESLLKEQADGIWEVDNIKSLQEAVDGFLAVAPRVLPVTREIQRFKNEQLRPLFKLKEPDPRMVLFDEMEQAWKGFLKQKSAEVPVYYMISLQGKVKVKGQSDYTNRFFNLFFSEDALRSFSSNMNSFNFLVIKSSRGRNLDEVFMEIDLRTYQGKWHYSVNREEVIATPRNPSILDQLNARRVQTQLLAPHCRWLEDALERSKKRTADDLPLLGDADTFAFLERLLDGFDQDAPYPRAIMAEGLLKALLDGKAAKEAEAAQVPFVVSLRGLQQDIHKLLQDYGLANQWEQRHAVGDDGTMLLSEELAKLGKRLPEIGKQAADYLETVAFLFVEAGGIYWNYTNEKYERLDFVLPENLLPQQKKRLFYLNPSDNSMLQYSVVQPDGWRVNNAVQDACRHLILYYKK